MRTRRPLIAAVLLVMSPFTARALDLGFAQEDGGHAGSFLDYAASARSLGMGRAHAGVADDAAATYWNPAGLSQVERKDVVTLYSDLYEGTGFGFFSYAQPTADAGTFGLSLVSLRSGNYDRRDAFGRQQGQFDTSELGVLLSYGTALDDRWSVGTTLKGVRHDVDSYGKTGYGADLALMNRFLPTLQVGLVAHNILAPKIKLARQSDTYPRAVRLGLKWQPHSRFILASDLGKSENRSLKVNLGTEWMVSNLVALRTGINETDLSAGLGFKLGDWSLDYAFAYHDAVSGVKDLGSAHQFGFHVNFGKKATDHVASLRWLRRGEIYLEALSRRMDELDSPMTEEAAKLIDGTKEAIRHQAFMNPQDLYTAQGYVYYLEGQYERSVMALGEALALQKDDTPASVSVSYVSEDGVVVTVTDLVLATLQRHFDKAKAQMTDEKARDIVASQLRKIEELYEAGDYRATVTECQKVLSFNSENVEAAAYLEDAQARLREPILREMRIAKAHMAKGAFLDAIKSLKRVKELDPENEEAGNAMNEAIAALEKNAELLPDPNSARGVYPINNVAAKSRDLYSLGLSLYSQGKLKEAVLAWEQAVKFDGNNVLARNAYQRAVTELSEPQ